MQEGGNGGSTAGREEQRDAAGVQVVAAFPVSTAYFFLQVGNLFFRHAKNVGSGDWE